MMTMITKITIFCLICRLSAGRFPRHKALNDVIKRALDSSGMHSILEPAGLDRGDGKRPDGMTTFPFSNGKCLLWDATCCDTFSPSAILSSASSPGSAARSAESNKSKKYRALSDRFHFQPFAVETSGVIGPSSLSFLRSLGNRISDITGDLRETSFLLQRISLAIVRSNTMAILSASRQTYCAPYP